MGSGVADQRTKVSPQLVFPAFRAKTLEQFLDLCKEFRQFRGDVERPHVSAFVFSCPDKLFAKNPESISTSTRWFPERHVRFSSLGWRRAVTYLSKIMTCKYSESSVQRSQIAALSILQLGGAKDNLEEQTEESWYVVHKKHARAPVPKSRSWRKAQVCCAVH